MGRCGYPLKRLKYIATICNGQEYKHIEGDEHGIPVYGSGGVFAYANKPIYEGISVLLGRKGTIDKPLYVDEAFWTVDTMYYTRIKADNYPKYVYYACNTIPFEFLQYGSAVPSMTSTDLGNTYLPFPDYETQKLVASYLDEKASYLSEVQSMYYVQLSMLTRYKRDLIAECVTKGLNKDAPMRHSGEDWIGDVPEHWKITKLKWMFEIVKRIYGEEDREVLAITQHGIKRKDMESNKGQYAESYTTYQVVNINDFAMNSMDLLTGWVDCSPYEGVTSPDYRVFRFYEDKPQCHAYFKYLFQMCYTNRIFYRLGQGVSNLGRWRLQTEQFRNIKLPQPPVEEQERIAAYLDEKIRQIDAIVDGITSQIQKLKDYRRILIHDAVTGKIKI